MSTLQTLMALVVLIFVLSVIVQAVQEVLKSVLNTKANTLRETVKKFMGEHLKLSQVEGALQIRGLGITALEHFNKEDFRHLLDGIQFEETQLRGIVAKGDVTLDQAKDNVAAAYEAARGAFQKAYTTKNKTFAVILSFLVVLTLNANLIMLYQDLATDQVVAQAIVGKATPGECGLGNKGTNEQAQGNAQQSQQSDLATTYSDTRNCIATKMKEYPILVRNSKRQSDWTESAYYTILGLFLMGLLVSLGAPFWNDVLKGTTGINNALNSNAKKTS